MPCSDWSALHGVNPNALERLTLTLQEKGNKGN